MAETLAVFVMVPGVLGAVTTMVTVALAELASVPKLQLIVVVPPHVPWVVVGAENGVTPAGSMSVNITLVAVDGPLLVTVSV